MERPTCTQCAAELDADARFCHRCGAEVRPASCTSCGAEREADARFCPQCGKAVGTQPALAPAGSGEAAPAEPAAPGGAQRTLSLVVLGLLAAILTVAVWSFLRSSSPPGWGVAAPQAAAPVATSPLVGPGGPAAPAAAAEPAPAAAAEPAPAAPTEPAPAAPTEPGASAPGAPGTPTAPAAQPEGAAAAPRAAAEPHPTPGDTLVFPHALPEDQAGEPAAGGGGGAAIAGTIEVAPELAAQIKPGSVIFLVARPVGDAAQRPIAVAKIPLAAFPIPFAIGEENLMGGSWGGPVDISARLDQDEDARSKMAGDLYGEAVGNPIRPGDARVRVVLDRAL